MVSCAVCGTSKSARAGNVCSPVTFHVFPKNPVQRKIWIDFVDKSDWQPTNRSVICSKHFAEECFDRTSLSVIRLRPKSVPTYSVHRQKYDRSFKPELLVPASHHLPASSLAPSESKPSSVNSYSLTESRYSENGSDSPTGSSNGDSDSTQSDKEECDTLTESVKENNDMSRSVEESCDSPTRSMEEKCDSPMQSIEESCDSPTPSMEEGCDSPARSIEESCDSPTPSMEESQSSLSRSRESRCSSSRSDDVSFVPSLTDTLRELKLKRILQKLANENKLKNKKIRQLQKDNWRLRTKLRTFQVTENLKMLK